MTPTDTLPSQSDSAATQAVYPLRLPAARNYPNNLPLELNRFIGRERELTEIKTLLWSTRLLTLTGPGGSGKTRLAARLAHDLLDAFADGVWLVELAALSDPTLVPQAFAFALDLREQAGRPAQQVLIDYFKSREALLLLDNCEHLIMACAQLVEAMLRACPNLLILATSCEALNIAGEIAWLVPPLSLPDLKATNPADTLQQSEAVQLFIDRAISVQPKWIPGERDVAIIGQICQRLDGLPLAIELAASRVRTLSVEQIAARLDERFRLLTYSKRTDVPRHQTLRALIDWSYSLLSDTGRILLRRLSVFLGGWTLEAAETVCSGDDLDSQLVLDVLTHLVDKSLVQAKEHYGVTRYIMLETIRQYAHERLLESGELRSVQHRHLHFILQLVDAAQLEKADDNQKQRLECLVIEHDNFRVALGWSLENDVEAGLKLACRQSIHYWEMSGGLREGFDWLSRLLARPEASARTSTRARALEMLYKLSPNWSDAPRQAWLEESLAIWQELGEQSQVTAVLSSLGALAAQRVDLIAARAYYTECLRLYQYQYDEIGMADTLNRLGGVAIYQGDLERGQVLLEESVRIFRQLGLRGRVSVPLGNLGHIALCKGNLAQARELIETSLTLSRGCRGERSSSWLLITLGEVEIRAGNYAAARACLEESLALQEPGYNILPGWIFQSLALLARMQGDYEQASPLDKKSLTLLKDNKLYVAGPLEGMASTWIGQEQAERAAQLLGAAAAYRERIGTPLAPLYRADVEHDLAVLKATMSQAAFAAAWAAGRSMTIEQAIHFVLGDDKPTMPMERLYHAATAAPDLSRQFSGLTAREQEVVTLVARGKSNRDIAAALVLSERTVASHVSNILSKLEFDSRTQIAAWAIEKGLTKPPA